MSTLYIGTPPSILTRPADTNAYAQNDLISSNTTAASIVVPGIKMLGGTAGLFKFKRYKLYTNVTTGWGSATFTLRLWSISPTYTNGDNGAYAIATGAANFLDSAAIATAQFSDGAAGIGVPDKGTELTFPMTSGGQIFWDLQYTASGALTPISAQTLTLICEIQPA